MAWAFQDDERAAGGVDARTREIEALRDAVQDTFRTAWWEYPNALKHTEGGRVLAAEIQSGEKALDDLLARVHSLEQEAADERAAHEATGERLAEALAEAAEREKALRHVDECLDNDGSYVTEMLREAKRIADSWATRNEDARHIAALLAGVLPPLADAAGVVRAVLAGGQGENDWKARAERLEQEAAEREKTLRRIADCPEPLGPRESSAAAPRARRPVCGGDRDNGGRTMSEWYCERCRRWSGTTCCPGCLQINPQDAPWMSQREIQEAREKALRP